MCWFLVVAMPKMQTLGTSLGGLLFDSLIYDRTGLRTLRLQLTVTHKTNTGTVHPASDVLMQSFDSCKFFRAVALLLCSCAAASGPRTGEEVLGGRRFIRLRL